MAELSITRNQLKRLQVLYSQLCARTFEENTREARLAWAAQLVGHSLATFRDLSLSEARHLIDVLQGQLGVKYPAQRRHGRDDADRHGRDGRRDGGDLAATPQMVNAGDLATIEEYFTRLGWTRERFDAWLRSPHSPLKASSPAIRTKAEANRVRWALKGMLQQRGLWQERKPA